MLSDQELLTHLHSLIEQSNKAPCNVDHHSTLYTFLYHNFSRIVAKLQPTSVRKLYDSIRVRTEQLMLSGMMMHHPKLGELCVTASEMIFNVCTAHEIEMVG